jgi:hypothetical protein
MLMTRQLLLLVLAAAVAATQLAKAADEKKPVNKPALNARDAGQSFATQGEYTGTLKCEDGKDCKWGVQVISLNDGKFRAVSYKGGLPGDGWDGKKDERIQSEGTADDSGVVRFSHKDEGRGALSDGKLTITSPNGEALGHLKRVVRESPTLGKKAPEGAVVLFDGSTADTFNGGRLTEDKLLEQGCTSKDTFQSFTLHVEFMLSYMPYAGGQGRSNSGCYMQGRYEVQVLDSFGLDGKHNECGGIYSIKDPDVNMCLPPLSWQTYDVEFTTATFDEAGKKTKNATMTVLHNGVKIHENVELPKGTTAAPVREGADPGPIYFQNHNNPVRYRNIWVVRK